MCKQTQISEFSLIFFPIFPDILLKVSQFSYEILSNFPQVSSQLPQDFLEFVQILLQSPPPPPPPTYFVKAPRDHIFVIPSEKPYTQTRKTPF